MEILPYSSRDALETVEEEIQLTREEIRALQDFESRVKERSPTNTGNGLVFNGGDSRVFKDYKNTVMEIDRPERYQREVESAGKRFGLSEPVAVDMAYELSTGSIDESTAVHIVRTLGSQGLNTPAKAAIVQASREGINARQNTLDVLEKEADSVEDYVHELYEFEQQLLEMNEEPLPWTPRDPNMALENWYTLRGIEHLASDLLDERKQEKANYRVAGTPLGFQEYLYDGERPVEQDLEELSSVVEQAKKKVW